MTRDILRNCLRTYRRRLGFSQKDIAFLLGSTRASKISRHERGLQRPTIGILIAYELLFDTSLRDIYAELAAEHGQLLCGRLRLMLENADSQRWSTMKRTAISEVLNRCEYKSKNL
jgi:DNA-binding XRE family transcriptional regulator